MAVPARENSRWHAGAHVPNTYTRTRAIARVRTRARTTWSRTARHAPMPKRTHKRTHSHAPMPTHPHTQTHARRTARMARKVRMLCMARHAKLGKARHGMHGTAQHGTTRQGIAWQGTARHGTTQMTQMTRTAHTARNACMARSRAPADGVVCGVFARISAASAALIICKRSRSFHQVGVEPGQTQ